MNEYITAFLLAYETVTPVLVEPLYPSSLQIPVPFPFARPAPGRALVPILSSPSAACVREYIAAAADSTGKSFRFGRKSRYYENRRKTSAPQKDPVFSPSLSASAA
jgi:hypothetical protein